jgi:hypothetical protein
VPAAVDAALDAAVDGTPPPYILIDATPRPDAIAIGQGARDEGLVHPACHG